MVPYYTLAASFVDNQFSKGMDGASTTTNCLSDVAAIVFGRVFTQGLGEWQDDQTSLRSCNTRHDTWNGQNYFSQGRLLVTTWKDETCGRYILISFNSEEGE
jgi:hypothetical protein